MDNNHNQKKTLRLRWRLRMRYKAIADLPENIKALLTPEAQKIYRCAFNKAWKEYKKIEYRDHTNMTREQFAHQAAWSEIELKCEHNNDTGQWQPKNND